MTIKSSATVLHTYLSRIAGNATRLASLRLFALTALFICFTTNAHASSQFDIIGPVGSGAFGTRVTALPNGNIVITDPLYDAPGPIVDVGAVYLYNGTTLALISTLTGSTANDQVGGGGGGVTVLTNGNYVVRSPQWDGAAANVGAVTWGNGTTGVSGVVSSSNSLVGSTLTDQIGNGVTALTNGNYVVISTSWDGAAADAGAVTWANGTTGISGVVSSTNSLVGSTLNDNVGNSGVTGLPNGNYIFGSANWDNGAATNAGAVTWGNGTTGTSGVVSAANSLVGSTSSDFVGSITVLTNGNYVVRSPNWDGTAADVGAVTWGNGTTGTSGVVSAANSLVGSTSSDQVGVGGVTVLPNGNYVVASQAWDGAAVNVGAVTWGNGTTGITGVVSSANSLVGSTASDGVGVRTAGLTNGNYIVGSQAWDGAAVNVGAVTWGNGTTGITGVVSAANSLVGSTLNDQISSGGLQALTNGNYVVRSINWNGAAANVGAVTWGNGTTGTTGVVSPANSLVGSTGNDNVGTGTAALTNGNYVVRSPFWDGTAADVGAATWGNGATGTSGVVSSANSLVGSTANDNVGGTTTDVVTALTNGNYVVRSTTWDGVAVNVGAVTWGNGTSGTSGVVSSANSLVGSTAGDGVGFVMELANGNYVVNTLNWDNGAATNAGAVTWGNGASGTFGVVSAANSLVGSTTNDIIGNFVSTALPNGAYVVYSSIWDNGAIVNAGAISYGTSTGGTVGPVTAANSVRGTAVNGGGSLVFSFNAFNQTLVVGRPASNIVTIFTPDGVTAVIKSRADFDGDGRTDLSVFRPSEGNWYLNRSTAGFSVINWGISTDVLVPGDFDGDGKADTAVARFDANSANADFFILNSATFTLSGVSWGVPNDVPVSGDYDGDGKTDVAVFRPSNNTWYVLKSTGGITVEPFGLAGDVPLAIDNDGDGRTNIAIFRPSSNTWYIARPTGTPATSFDALPFGLAGDKLVPADYDGDNKDDVAVFRPSTGQWIVRGSFAGTTTFSPWGISTDTPVPGDYDGDGKDDLAVYRGGTWYINRSTAGSQITAFGIGSDTPIPARYIP